MPRFFAMTGRGLSDVLEVELRAMGAETVLKAPGGAFFEGDWSLCYRANLRSRTASRIVLPLMEFAARSPDELYANLQKHDWSQHASAGGTMAVEASVRDSQVFRDQRFVAMKTKDAIVDQFRDKFGERPNVDVENPDMRVIVRCVGDRFSVSLDTSGDALFKRGYRVESIAAPLKENVAAALLASTEWDRQSPVVDPMCGSGTFLIEAALMAMNVAPGTLRRRFAFQRFPDFDTEAWEREVDAAADDEIEELPFKFYGYDIDRKSVAAARANVKKAGLEDVIEIHRAPVETLTAPSTTGLFVTNPPYGERIGDKGDLLETYRNLAFTMKSQFKGWTCWILSGDPELSAAMKLKATRKVPVMNGRIECRFLRYEMFKA